jgi:branched-subunit amino acid aminotransferase/4-amino-4-deoxychorismate lyase
MGVVKVVWRLGMKTQYNFFSHNGKILPISGAVVPLTSVEYSYGFGVYETLRVSKRKVLYVAAHVERLMKSAKIIGLEHNFTSGSVNQAINELVEKNKIESCNIKLLLIGSQDSASANLYILCLNPLFPDRKLYSTGAKCITQKYERPFPHAKTLNMLQSYLAYRAAKQSGAYDALAVNQAGCITEGTRTNFFAIKDKQIISPPEKDILLGVTREHALEAAKQNGFDIVERDIMLSSLNDYDGFFLTSTSSKIMPISTIDDQTFEIPDNLRELMSVYDQFLATL